MTRSHRLHHHGIAGAVACRAFLLIRIGGGLSHVEPPVLAGALFHVGVMGFTQTDIGQVTRDRMKAATSGIDT